MYGDVQFFISFHTLGVSTVLGLSFNTLHQILSFTWNVYLFFKWCIFLFRWCFSN